VAAIFPMILHSTKGLFSGVNQKTSMRRGMTNDFKFNQMVSQVSINVKTHVCFTVGQQFRKVCKSRVEVKK